MQALVLGALVKEVELGVPVVNPALVTLKFAEMLVQSRLAPSKLAYPQPPKPLAI